MNDSTPNIMGWYVIVHSAQDLPLANPSDDRIDPYVVLSIGDEEVTTSVAESLRHPVWDETLYLTATNFNKNRSTDQTVDEEPSLCMDSQSSHLDSPRLSNGKNMDSPAVPSLAEMEREFHCDDNNTPDNSHHLHPIFVWTDSDHPRLLVEIVESADHSVCLGRGYVDQQELPNEERPADVVVPLSDSRDHYINLTIQARIGLSSNGRHQLLGWYVLVRDAEGISSSVQNMSVIVSMGRGKAITAESDKPVWEETLYLHIYTPPTSPIIEMETVKYDEINEYKELPVVFMDDSSPCHQDISSMVPVFLDSCRSEASSMGPSTTTFDDDPNTLRLDSTKVFENLEVIELTDIESEGSLTPGLHRLPSGPFTFSLDSIHALNNNPPSDEPKPKEETHYLKVTLHNATNDDVSYGKGKLGLSHLPTNTSPTDCDISMVSHEGLVVGKLNLTIQAHIEDDIDSSSEVQGWYVLVRGISDATFDPQNQYISVSLGGEKVRTSDLPDGQTVWNELLYFIKPTAESPTRQISPFHSQLTSPVKSQPDNTIDWNNYNPNQPITPSSNSYHPYHRLSLPVPVPIPQTAPPPSTSLMSSLERKEFLYNNNITPEEEHLYNDENASSWKDLLSNSNTEELKPPLSPPRPRTAQPRNRAQSVPIVEKETETTARARWCTVCKKLYLDVNGFTSQAICQDCQILTPNPLNIYQFPTNSKGTTENINKSFDTEPLSSRSSAVTPTRGRPPLTPNMRLPTTPPSSTPRVIPTNTNSTTNSLKPPTTPKRPSQSPTRLTVPNTARGRPPLLVPTPILSDSPNALRSNPSVSPQTPSTLPLYFTRSQSQPNNNIAGARWMQPLISPRPQTENINMPSPYHPTRSRSAALPRNVRAAPAAPATPSTARAEESGISSFCNVCNNKLDPRCQGHCTHCRKPLCPNCAAVRSVVPGQSQKWICQQCSSRGLFPLWKVNNSNNSAGILFGASHIYQTPRV
eukprot:NODE_248_length_3147_cov_11.118386_g214_i0.p1 GENE.NODE_248_length_3147_cov_11.118386_g214_i0~~NODE_248_length_3147_cov_11.118386_g214_i0.p1  ORF type:complete len:1016 (-),score=229.68 NODE_248_length_3147_cov_11.118386_g214_i0:98-3031(-)